MQIIQADADTFVSNPDPVEDERAAREWADVVVEVGTARAVAEEMPDTCVHCGKVIEWVPEFALWAVGGDVWSQSRCWADYANQRGSHWLKHAPVVEVVR